MRLYEYLNDEYDKTTIEKVLKILKRDCKPIIDVYKKTDFILDRNINNFDKTNYNTPIIKFKTRKNRKPMDTEPMVHDYLDNLFRKVFGWGVRSEGLWTRGKRPIVSSNLVFPIGNFKFVWSPKIYDLTIDLFPIFRVKAWKGSWIFTHETEDEFKDYMKNVITEDKWKKIYTDKDLIGALKSKNEISINCKEYYLVDGNFLLAAQEKMGVKNWKELLK